jgi:integrase
VAHVDTWRAHLAEHGGFQGRPAAPKTIARKLAAIASLYDYLVVEGILDHSPAEHARRPRISKDYAATVSLDEAQIRAVLVAARAAGGVTHAAVVALALTGARAAEILAADVTDLVDDHGHRCLNLRRKGGEMDRVILPTSAAHVITRYVDGRQDGALLQTPDGGRLTYDALLWMVGRVGRRAGLPATLTLHPHMLRASFATISFDHGVPGDRIQDALGHADPRTTRLYDRGRRRLRRKAEPGAVVAKHVMDDDA